MWRGGSDRLALIILIWRGGRNQLEVILLMMQGGMDKLGVFLLAWRGGRSWLGMVGVLVTSQSLVCLTWFELLCHKTTQMTV